MFFLAIQVLTEEDCHSDQFLLTLKLWEKNEALQQRQLSYVHIIVLTVVCGCVC